MSSSPPGRPVAHGSLPVTDGPLVVGRQMELGQLVGPLEDPGVRVATLTGPLGVGKTSLALAAPSALTAGCADGVASWI